MAPPKKSQVTREPSLLEKALQGVVKTKASDDRRKQQSRSMDVVFTDPLDSGGQVVENSLSKSLVNILDGGGKNIERLAFEIDPAANNQYSGLYMAKLRLTPDSILKRVAIQNDLVAAIHQARGSHVGVFGRRRPDRFSFGFVVEPRPGVMDNATPEQQEDLQNRIDKMCDKLITCGETRGWGDNDRMSFTQYLYMSTRDALTFGRIATEIVQIQDQAGNSKPHSFRPIDAGTVYRAAPQKTAAQAVRDQARGLIEQIKNKKLIPERFEKDEYAWVQVVEGRPVQAFTAQECVVHNFYPVTNVELSGYPLTPIDTILSAVLTHINITTHNKMYFQSGRASRGMLVIQSDDIDETVVSRIRQQFNASINSVNNAWRMPVFGVGQDAQVTYQSIDQGQRDAEFQYLSDSNARTILSAYQMSPDELPGYSHLSRGTNSQALSECFDRGSCLWTDKGFSTATELLDGRKEVPVRVWTGREFAPARLFETGEKQLVETRAGGQCLKTSPDHRFRVLTEDGELVWRRQEQLALGDLLVVNALPVAGDKALIPDFEGRELTPELMEVLGWLTGDGTLVSARPGIHGGAMKLFYHQAKERDIWEEHNRVLCDFGFSVKHHERLVSEQEEQALKERYGFKSIASSRITNIVYNSKFNSFLAGLGFSHSSEGKTIPPVFNVLPLEYRRAFLRGLFSADGHATKTGAVVLTIQDDRTREQVRQMLLGLGIRTLGCEGIVRGENTLGGDIQKQLFIKDKNSFWGQIGFLQAHKQARRRDQKWSLGEVPAGLAAKLSNLVRASAAYSTWSKGVRDHLTAISSGKPKVSFNRLRRAMEDAGVPLPTWMTDYHLEPVTDLVVHQTRVPMVDVEVFDSQHAQILQGFQVHNSNNEYKLQAARDVGLKPLIKQWEDFINAHILPIIDPTLAKLVVIEFRGLDAETAEKESIRIQQDAPVHMTYDEILDKVEKDPIGKEWGGEFSLNPQFQQILDNHTGLTVGEIAAHFLGRKDLKDRPDLQYVRDPLWFQFQNLLLQQQQMQAQAQQPQQPPGGQDENGQPTSKTEDSDLTRSINQALGLLTKSEAQLPASKRRLLAQHRATVDNFIRGWEEDIAEATKAIIRVAKTKAPKGK
jgi:hypothetical protein